MTTGERIKELRSKLGLSQTSLASRVETDSAFISRWEKDSPETDGSMSEIKAVNGRINNSEFMERLIKNQLMVVYETDTERMLIPATVEGFNFIREMRGEKTTGNLTVAR